MQAQILLENAGAGETQLDVIRNLMLAAAQSGEWLTLEEIAGQTGFGAASVSAQLRHLRKPRYGRYHVEKRRRNTAPHDAADVSAGDITACVWEYKVLP